MSAWLHVRTQLDRAVALVLLVALAPVIAACAWSIRRHDGGPSLVRVPRVGRTGAPLAMWKLRSMHATDRGGLASGPALAAGDRDDRITDVGRWLRRYRLDELPQLWHVVRGEMALLGPRPEAPDYVAVDDPQWRTVLQAPPGIAGVTQVLVNSWEAERLQPVAGDAYRAEILPVKLAVDAWYVRCATPLLDVRIAIDTVRRRSGRRSGVWRSARRAVPELEAIPD